MNWFIWAVLSAFFAGLTAVLAKVGVENVNSNLATAIRTVVILISLGRSPFSRRASHSRRLEDEPGFF